MIHDRCSRYSTIEVLRGKKFVSETRNLGLLWTVSYLSEICHDYV